MKRPIFYACMLLLLGCASAPAAESVRNGADLPAPGKWLGTWILADTGQCANRTDMLIIAPTTVQFGNGPPRRIRFVPKGGPFGGDSLQWRIAAEEDVLEYDPDNDRMIWQSKGPDHHTTEYYERCAS